MWAIITPTAHPGDAAPQAPPQPARVERKVLERLAKDLSQLAQRAQRLQYQIEVSGFLSQIADVLIPYIRNNTLSFEEAVQIVPLLPGLEWIAPEDIADAILSALITQTSTYQQDFLKEVAEFERFALQVAEREFKKIQKEEEEQQRRLEELEARATAEEIRRAQEEALKAEQQEAEFIRKLIHEAVYGTAKPDATTGNAPSKHP